MTGNAKEERSAL